MLQKNNKPKTILTNPKKKLGNNIQYKEIHIHFDFNNNQKQIIGEAKAKRKTSLR